MNSSDIFVSLIIVIIFILLYAFNFFVIGIQRIKDNWPQYRCNPVVMPFASVFGVDTNTNFTYCIQNLQSNYIGYLLKPLTYNVNVLGQMGSTLTGNLGNMRGLVGYVRNAVKKITEGIFSVLGSIVIEIQRLSINIKDMMGKLFGVLSTLLHTMNGAIMTMESMWDGPPGQAVRWLCFDPETGVQLQDGQVLPMRDLPLNSLLKNGARVCAVMHISNLDEMGQPVEAVFEIAGGEDKKPIYVSGSHLVYDPAQGAFVQVEQLAAAKRTDRVCPIFTCLITSDHTIPLGKWIFHDWEDNQGSPAKNLAPVPVPVPVAIN